MSASASRPLARAQKVVLLLSILGAGFSGMIAEYSVSTAVAYLAGSSVSAYSILISTFMLSMGIGAFASRRVRARELEAFLLVQILLSVACASSTVLLAEAARLDRTWDAGLLLATFIGSLIGFEIPLLLRINEARQIVLRDNVAIVFGADYLGAFLAGLSFSLILLPHLGLVITPIFGGAVNLAIAAAVAAVFRRDLRSRGMLVVVSAGVAVVGGLALRGQQIVFAAEQAMYQDPIVYREQTRYQNIIITQTANGFCLYLDGQTQLCSVDEARYHETLVHPAFALRPDARHVLVLGGGDGMAVREILKYPRPDITVVDLDPAMFALARNERRLSSANGRALDDPRVATIAGDAMRFLATSTDVWDIIYLDLPDPSTPELAKLYSLELYQRVRARLAPGGVVVTQATSPIHATAAFVTIRATMQAAGFSVVPYRTNVPTFGDWGFLLAQRADESAVDGIAAKLESFNPDVPTRHLNRAAMQASLRFEKGIFPDDPTQVSVSRLLRPTVLAAYETAWRRIK